MTRFWGSLRHFHPPSWQITILVIFAFMYNFDSWTSKLVDLVPQLAESVKRKIRALSACMYCPTWCYSQLFVGRYELVLGVLISVWILWGFGTRSWTFLLYAHVSGCQIHFGNGELRLNCFFQFRVHIVDEWVYASGHEVHPCGTKIMVMSKNELHKSSIVIPSDGLQRGDI